MADGNAAGEGSTNWSASGEGTLVDGRPGGAGYNAQNNTQSIITDSDTIGRFTAELIAEHMIAQKQAAATGSITSAPLPKGARPHPPIKRVKPKPSKSFHADK